MFDVTAQLVNNQEENNCLDKILWGKNSWRHLSLINDETVINLQSSKVYVFSDSVLCFGKVFQHPECNEAWKNRVAGVRSEKSYRDIDSINGESTEFEWNIFPGFTTLQLKIKSMIYWATWDEHQKHSQEEFYSCQFSMTSRVTEKTTKMIVWQIPESWKYLRENLVLDSGHLLDQVLRKSGILPRIVHKELGTTFRSKCCWNSQKSGHLTFRATTPLSRGILKSKGKLSIHFTADYPTIETIFRIIMSANQLRIFGAVANICKEFWSSSRSIGGTWCTDGTITFSRWN